MVCLLIVDSLRQEWMKVSLRLIRTLLDLDQKVCELEASLEVARLDLTIDHLGRGSGLLNSTQGLDLVSVGKLAVNLLSTAKVLPLDRCALLTGHQATSRLALEDLVSDNNLSSVVHLALQLTLGWVWVDRTNIWVYIQDSLLLDVPSSNKTLLGSKTTKMMTQAKVIARVWLIRVNALMQRDGASSNALSRGVWVKELVPSLLTLASLLDQFRALD